MFCLKHAGMQNGERGLGRLLYTGQSPLKKASELETRKPGGVLISGWRKWLTQPSFTLSHLRGRENTDYPCLWEEIFVFVL